MKNTLKPLCAALMLFAASAAFADDFAPTFTSFGSLPAATFGGSGIPNDNVAITTIAKAGGGTITLGLSATQRFGNPPLTNDGAGTFYAGIGGDVLNGKPTYGIWNWDWYVSGLGLGDTVKLVYDRDPVAGNDLTSFFFLGNTNAQDSWNLGFSFLTGPAYNPNANGTYNFGIVVSNSEGFEIGRVAERVVATGVPDGGNMLAMVAGAVGLLGLARRTGLLSC